MHTGMLLLLKDRLLKGSNIRQGRTTCPKVLRISASQGNDRVRARHSTGNIYSPPHNCVPMRRKGSSDVGLESSWLDPVPYHGADSGNAVQAAMGECSVPFMALADDDV